MYIPRAADGPCCVQAQHQSLQHKLQAEIQQTNSDLSCAKRDKEDLQDKLSSVEAASDAAKQSAHNEITQLHTQVGGLVNVCSHVHSLGVCLRCLSQTYAL